MTFGPESTNPRERRAYAHTMIAVARASGTNEDFAAAEHAVQSTAGRKAEASGFHGALVNAALADVATKAIVVPATALLDPARRQPVSNSMPKLTSSSVRSDWVSKGDAYFGRTQECEPDGTISRVTPLMVTGIIQPHGIIPTVETGDHGVDIIAVRQKSDYLRDNLARLIRIATQDSDLPRLPMPPIS